jgi:hypothetical protein
VDNAIAVGRQNVPMRALTNDPTLWSDIHTNSTFVSSTPRSTSIPEAGGNIGRRRLVGENTKKETKKWKIVRKKKNDKGNKYGEQM